MTHHLPTKRGSGPDLVLIDDDAVIRDIWFFEAEIHGLRLLALSDSSELHDYDLAPDVPIYVDLQLSNGVSGVDVARSLAKQGFSHIAMTTGHQIDRSTFPEFISDVVGKDFPVNQSQQTQGC